MKPSLALIGMPRSGTPWMVKAIDSHLDMIQKIAIIISPIGIYL